MSQVRYFVPEDGDTEQAPNVFLAPKPSRPGYPPLLGQIKKAFPLPGTYHFRFKTNLVPGYERGPVVWMDVEDNNEPVPALQNIIFAKVTRISLENEDEFEGDSDIRKAGNYPHHVNKVADAVPQVSMKKDHPYARSAPASVSNTPTHTPRSTPTPNLGSHHNVDADLLGGGFGGGTTSNVGAISSDRTREGNSASLLDGFDESGGSVPVAVSSPSDSLLDMPQSSAPAASSSDHDFFGTSTSHSEPVRAQPSSHHNDFLGMHAPAPSNPLPNVSQQVPGSSNMTSGGYGNSMNYRPQSNGHHQQKAPAPSSGNARGTNAFDTFSKNTSPFSDFGNFT